MQSKPYCININGKLVEVSQEIYLAYYRSKRRDRYFEHDIKTGRPIRDKDGNITGYTPSKEDSLERLMDNGVVFVDRNASVESIVVRRDMIRRLHEALRLLTGEERELIGQLFFSNDGDGMSERQYAERSGIPRKTVAYRRDKVLRKMKKLMES